MTDLNAVLDAARKAGAQQAEAYQIANEETPVKFEANRLKELNSRHSSGVALRVIAGGRIGFASSTRPDDVDDLVGAAMETAPFGPEAHFDFPEQAEAPAVETFDPATASFTAVGSRASHARTSSISSPTKPVSRRAKPRTRCPAARSPPTTWRPSVPVAPATSTVSTSPMARV